MIRVHAEKTFICDTCGNGFAWKGGLTGHIRAVHSKVTKQKKQHACDMCSKLFTNAKSLIIHERSVHTGN